MEAPELYTSLTQLPSQKLNRTAFGDFSSFDEKKSEQMSCSRIVRPEGSVEQQCNLDLNTLGAAALQGAVIRGTQALGAANNGSAVGGWQPGTLGALQSYLQDTRVANIPSTQKSAGPTVSATGFQCPAGSVCDTPHYSPGDPGYKAGSAQ